MQRKSWYSIGGTAGVSIFKEASGQGYITNKVKLASLACEDDIDQP